MVKKIPLTSPLLVNGKFVTNFLEKANIIDDFFSKQYQPIFNDSILPLISSYHASNRLNDINLNYGKILKVIRSWHPNKAHSDHSVLVRMLRLSCPLS